MSAPFVWFDLTVAEGGETAAFYQDLFGWEADPGAAGYESWLTDSGQPWAGTVPGGPAPAGRWVPYVPVAGLDAAVERAIELRGTVVRGKVSDPAGTSVIVSGPGGALIALFTPAAG
jgi:hypothetical protein